MPCGNPSCTKPCGGAVRLCEMCPLPGVKKCSRCNATYYCGAEHQRANWKEHKAYCKSVASLAASGEAFSMSTLTAGDDKRPLKPGDSVTIDYAGRLASGKQFDSSKPEGRPPKPLTFTVGAGEVVPGFDGGVARMCVGETARLYISPPAGYGARGVPGAIPSNSYLIFDVEVLSAEPATATA